MIRDGQKKAKRRDIAEVDTLTEEVSKSGVKLIGAYWTFGRYDTVFIFEAPDEKVAMKAALPYADIVNSETLVAIPRSEAVKLVG